MVPRTQVVARAERSRFRSSLGGEGRDGNVTLLLSMLYGRLSRDPKWSTSGMPVGYSDASGSPDEGPEVGHLMYAGRIR